MKKWYMSKTMRFNLAVALFAALESQLQLLQPYVGQAGYTVLAVLIPVVNMYLRTVTKEGVQ